MDSKKLADEIASFEGIWEGGYFEGDPLDPLAKSTYGSSGYISVLHATYLRCIKPYIKPETVALEIGPGRGAWTKTMLGAKEVWALDALSAEYNRFFEYLNFPENVKYFQVKDFECKDLPEAYFDFMFSFGCLCHVSFDGIEAYARSIFPKLRSGANCFWLVADKDKFQALVDSDLRNNIWKRLAPRRRQMWPVRKVFDAISFISRPAFRRTEVFTGEQGTWYDAGTDRTCMMLESIGYQIVDPDVETISRDPVIHFVKP